MEEENKEGSILETELGGKVFKILLTHPNGLSGYEISRNLQESKQYLEKHTARKGISESYQGKTAIILKKMEKEGLIKRTMQKSLGMRTKVINTIDFEGLVKVVLKDHPKRKELNEEEIKQIANFLKSLNYEKILEEGKKNKNETTKAIGEIAQILRNSKIKFLFSKMNMLVLFQVILGFGSWILTTIPNAERSLKKSKQTALTEVYLELAKLPKDTLRKIACY